MAEPSRLQPKTDISIRTMLARVETALDALEDRTALRFDTLNAGHVRMDSRLDKIEGDVASTKEAVARIEGERTAERRSKPEASGARRVAVWTSIVLAVTAVLGFIASNWSAFVARALTVPHPPA